MTEATVAAADALLKKHGIRYVLVGGQAIAREAATATRDVDVMVTTLDYRDAIRRLRDDPDLLLEFEGGPVTRLSIRSLGRVPLDLIDAATFSGKRSDEEFFAYLESDGSTAVDGIRYATPEVVWYTRLLTKRWKAYGEKILTNVIDGLAADRLAGVEAIAKRFGTEDVIRTRLAYVREELKRPDLAAFLKSD